MSGPSGYAWLSAHVGDMDDLATLKAFDNGDEPAVQAITSDRPEVIIADRHPGLPQRDLGPAESGGIAGSHRPAPSRTRLASAMAENRHDGREPVIGVAFDGTGYGDDRAVWGGEILLADYDGYERVAHLRYVSLPGGDAGVRNPCRMALSHLHSAGCGVGSRAALCGRVHAHGASACSPASFRPGWAVRRRRAWAGCSTRCRPWLACCHRVAYEAEAAMRFEGLARDAIQSSCRAILVRGWMATRRVPRNLTQDR